jgi:DNA-binding NtrC family response regulator
MLGSISICVEQVTGLKDARRKVQRGAFVVVLTEANLPDGTWHDVLDLAAELDCKVIVTHPHAEARLWVEALNLGAYDFITPRFAATEVQRIVGNALNCSQGIGGCNRLMRAELLGNNSSRC